MYTAVLDCSRSCFSFLEPFFVSYRVGNNESSIRSDGKSITNMDASPQSRDRVGSDLLVFSLEIINFLYIDIGLIDEYISRI